MSGPISHKNLVNNPFVLFQICSSDGLDLEDPSSVSQRRDLHVWLLHRYLKTRHPGEGAGRRLHHILMTLTYWEQVANIHKEQNVGGGRR